MAACDIILEMSDKSPLLFGTVWWGRLAQAKVAHNVLLLNLRQVNMVVPPVAKNEWIHIVECTLCCPALSSCLLHPGLRLFHELDSTCNTKRSTISDKLMKTSIKMDEVKKIIVIVLNMLIPGLHRYEKAALFSMFSS